MAKTILITVNEWLGSSHLALKKDPPVERLNSFLTSLPLTEALGRLVDYQRAYNEKFKEHRAVNFKIIAISDFAPLSDDVANELQLERIEDLTIEY